MRVDEDNVPILPGRSLRPKDAATLLLIRRDGPGPNPPPRVLMGRRARGHVFMAQKWVFPGGRIHPSDFRVPAASELAETVATPLCRTAPLPRARALAAAAVRELFEETGLVLGQPGQGRTRSPEWRDFLGLGYLPHLAPLQFVGRAITPPVRPRRFDARFFMADARELISLDPTSGSGELDEIAWFSWDEAEKLDLPSITRAILADVAARLADPARPIPYHRFDAGKHRLLHL